jgi:hypothetical protein
MEAIFFLKRSASISALLTVKSSPSMEHRMDPSSEDDALLNSTNSSREDPGSTTAFSRRLLLVPLLELKSNRREEDDVAHRLFAATIAPRRFVE